MKIYDVFFQVRVYCNGVWKLLDGNLKVPAESPVEAKKKIMNSKLDIFTIRDAREIDLSKL